MTDAEMDLEIKRMFESDKHGVCTKCGPSSPYIFEFFCVFIVIITIMVVIIAGFK